LCFRESLRLLLKGLDFGAMRVYYTGIKSSTTT
jgi:hypothetical protein